LGARMKTAGTLLLIPFIQVAIMQMSRPSAQAASAQSTSELTVKRLHEPGWWPTKGDAARNDYSGTEACAGCHEQEALAQRQTSMAKAASRALETEVLRSSPTISLDTLPFRTMILRGRKGSTYTVGRGGESLSGEILWAMGNGNMGRTFILESSASLFESQLSYYTAISALDLTPGHTAAGPRDMEKAFGERQNTETAQRCFGCHTTVSSVRGQLDPSHAIPGVTCEACHGPGARHVTAMSQNRIDEGKASILNPASFDPVRLVDYCGACHRTPSDVAAAKDYVPTNIRFQPYRLAKSRCWSQPDRRIACTACHNPHEEVARDVGFYDAKCLACHAEKTIESDKEIARMQDGHAAGKPPACPVSGSQCTLCHMPKYKVPQMHSSFTDHDIRIVHPGEPYPL